MQAFVLSAEGKGGQGWMVVNKSVPFLLFVVVYLIWEVISEAKNGRLVPIGYASCVFFLVFFVVGIVGNLLVATIAYFKLGHWALEAGVINASLKVAAYCGVPVGAGIWMLSWLKSRKDKKRH
ncbi:hypothetical protein [Pseudomonas carnis]|uniref:hypothetical protein n=1 Tax=Pseudomonas carnis TaxID=2487355 RepID=UPI0018E79AE5|nr:hypothetical protein [Pseudomonas carnis]MBA1297550.1 hypothetical protein [Pseudomonas carnis]MBJ2199832.1 hypothetical protein [Pseudomonas carnis]